jgi:hypothetical protein
MAPVKRRDNMQRNSRNAVAPAFNIGAWIKVLLLYT